MASGSVVNLLDMRDEEENYKGSGKEGGGGRWASRNPKAKAKSNTRNRRRNRPESPGGDGGARQSGFGRTRMNSQMSGLSQGSEYSEGEEEDGQARPSAADQAADAEAGGGKDKTTLFSKLQDQEGGNKGAAKELLNDDEEAQRDAPPLMANVSSGNGDGEIFSEARKIAQLRQLLKDEKPGLQGPMFKQNVWEYYMVKASWSDGLCVALNHSSMYGCCFVPCLWPYRLFLTIKRAAPLKIKMCKCCNCNCNPCCACPLTSIIFMFPVIAALTFLPQVSAMLEPHVKNLPWIGEQDGGMFYLSIALFFIGLFLMVFWWARVLLGVGMKYNILEAMDKPDKFTCKTMACICCMNMRVGVHVDRAQGFDKVLKSDRTTVELSDTMRLMSPPQQSVMV